MLLGAGIEWVIVASCAAVGAVVADRAFFRRTGRQPRDQVAATATMSAPLEIVRPQQPPAKPPISTDHARLAAALDCLPADILIFDADARLVQWNSNYVEAYGTRGISLAVGLSFEDLLHKIHRQGLIAEPELAEDDWVAWRTEAFRRAREPVLLHTRDGQWLQCIDRRLPDGGTVSLRYDVTELKRRERELEDATALLGGIRDNITQGIVVYDANQRLVTWNAQAARLACMPEGVYREGRPFKDILRYLASRGDFGPGDAEQLVAERLRNFSETTNSAFLSVQPNGAILDVRRGTMPDGGQIFAFTDITALKAHEREIERKSVLVTAILDNMNQGIAVYDASQCLIVRNAQADRLLNIPDGMFGIGSKLGDISRYRAERGEFGSRDPAEIAGERVRSLLSSDVPFREVKQSNGKILEVRRGTLPDGGLIFTYTDITAFKTREQDLARTTTLLQTTFDNMSQGMLVYDADGRMIAWNERALRLAGFPDGFCRIGRTTAEVLRFLAERGDFGPGDVDAITAEREREIAVLGLTRHERAQADGTVLDVWRSRMPDGGQIITYTDITALKAQERELADKSRLLRTTFDTIDQGIAVYDGTFRLVAWNDRWIDLLEIPRDLVVVGRPFIDFIRNSAQRGQLGEHDIDRIIAEKIQQGRQFAPFHAELSRKSGRILDLLSQPMPGGGFVETFTDITARRETENSLRQAQKMEAVGHMAGGMAHEFNNLLTVISGFGRMARKRPDDVGHVVTCLDEVIAAADQSAGLTRQMLTFGRKQIMELRVTPIASAVADAEAMLRPLLGERFAIENEIADAGANVRIDPGQMMQVLVNLALNARDAMGESGTIRIATLRLGEDDAIRARHPDLPVGPLVAVAISDTGCGMDEETQRRIFEPFFTTKPPGSGTGLGLSVAVAIVEQLGGRIDVRSAPGRGSTFTVCLPISTERKNVEEQDTDSIALLAPPTRTPRTILVAEDEDQVRRYITVELERLGYAVIGARNGSDGLAKFKIHRGRIDLVLTDVVMPEAGGADLAKAVREIRPEIPIIYMTGYPSRGHFRREDLGADAVILEKPFKAGSLSETLNAALAA